MKKNEMKIYQTPEAAILDLKLEGVLCASNQQFGTEDVGEGWGVELS